MQPFFVYILKCADGSYYTGHTDNMESRLSAHQQGLGGFYTAKRLPVELIYVETCGTRYEAISNEQRMKKWNKKKKEALGKQDWSGLREAAKKKFDKDKNREE